MTALALLLLTAAPSMGGENFELLGFTKDGAKLVWRRHLGLRVQTGGVATK